MLKLIDNFPHYSACKNTEYRCKSGSDVSESVDKKCIPKVNTCYGSPTCKWEEDEQASLCGKQKCVTSLFQRNMTEKILFRAVEKNNN